MKKEKFKSILYLLFALIFVFTNLSAQLKLGRSTLLSMPAPALCNPDHLSIGLKSQSFMATVGGVAFDKTAIPASDLKISNLLLDYRSGMMDGDRLELTVNGKQIHANIYDWQLIPIAKFADSRYYSCFTLFGKLDNAKKEKEIRERGDKILNYHPAFINTLLGLRLFQLDILILDNDCTDLPKDNDEYILGKGESPPDTLSNQQGMNNFIYHINEIESDLQMKFRSYVICDHERDIRFDFKMDSLSITGEPFYYCWRFKIDSTEYNQKEVQKQVLKEIDQKIHAEKKENPKIFDERKWYIQSIIEEAKNYESRYNIYSSGTVVDMLKIKSDEERAEFLEKYYTSSLKEILVHLRISMDACEVIYLKEYSERLSNRPDILRGINPAIWDAATNTMCYAAFFRFCKENYLEQWQKFMQQIENVTVEPELTTPTVMMDPQSKKIKR